MIHDENISFEEMCAICGKELAEAAREATIRIYCRAREIADQKGIIIADTKFEFGVYDGKLIIIDECLTPDSVVSGQKTSISRADRNPALTSSSCVTTWRPWTGQDRSGTATAGRDRT